VSEHGEESAGGEVIDHRRRSRQKGEIGLAPSFLAFAINGDAIELTSMIFKRTAPSML
jgi:hypothetical protein